MTLMPLLNRYFDRYAIVARLFPALLFTAPAFLVAIAVFPSLLSSIRNASAGLVANSTSCGTPA